MRVPRRRVAAAALLASSVVAGVLAPTTAQALPAASEQAAAEPKQKTMKDRSDNRMGTIRKLEEKLDVERELDDVLSNPDRQARWPGECDDPLNPFDSYPNKGFCWDERDFDERAWYPQGVSGSWDATNSGTYSGRRITVASWYQREEPDGSRVTFAVHKDDEPPEYRHVVLADPSGGDFKPVRAHAGGVAWVGDHLYVADTEKGLRAFDLRHIWKADGGEADDKYFIKDGEVHAAGYDYVLPQVGSYRTEDEADKPCDPDQGPYNSSVSVDRKTQRLVTGEFCGADAGDRQKGRIVRWPLDMDSGKVKSSNEKDPTVTSKDWYYTTQKQMQGVATYGNRVNSMSSRGKETPGVWHPASLEGKKTGDTLGEEEGHYRAPVPGTEAVSFNPHDKDGEGLYWTLSEYPGRRYVFPNDAEDAG